MAEFDVEEQVDKPISKRIPTPDDILGGGRKIPTPDDILGEKKNQVGTTLNNGTSNTSTSNSLSPLPLHHLCLSHL